MRPALTIGEVARRTDIAPTTRRNYDKIGTALRAVARGRAASLRRCRADPAGGDRVVQAAGFALDEIAVLLDDDAPGRPASRALAQAKLADIDTQMATLARARGIIEWAPGVHLPVDRRLHMRDHCNDGSHGR